MIIRQFEVKDAESILQIQEDVKETLGDLHTKDSLLVASQYIKYFIAEEASSIVGFVGFQDLNNGIGMLLSLAVAKNLQGKGVGTALVKEVKRYASTNKFRKLLYLCRINNKPMILLGIKEDFQPEGILRKHFRTGEDVLYMSYFIENEKITDGEKDG